MNSSDPAVLDTVLDVAARYARAHLQSRVLVCGWQTGERCEQGHHAAVSRALSGNEEFHAPA